MKIYVLIIFIILLFILVLVGAFIVYRYVPLSKNGNGNKNSPSPIPINNVSESGPPPIGQIIKKFRPLKETYTIKQGDYNYPIARNDIKHPNKFISNVEEKQYYNFPIFTKTGYKCLKLPNKLRTKLTQEWLKNRNKSKPEDKSNNLEKYVHNKNRSNPQDSTNASFMVDIDPNLSKDIEKWIVKELNKWTKINDKLEHTSTYGPREYKTDSQLEMHLDRPETHILSAIIHVGRILNDENKENWSLSIQNRIIPKSDIYFDSDCDVILYESSTLMHGRPEKFKGNSFCNMFMHWKPRNWDKKYKKLISKNVQKY